MYIYIHVLDSALKIFLIVIFSNSILEISIQ